LRNTYEPCQVTYLAWLLQSVRAPSWSDKMAHLFELGRGGRGNNLRSMEGLRGLAVFLVFLVHYATYLEPWIPAGSPTATVAPLIHHMGMAGVDLFFVLSGYLIYGHLMARPAPFGRYFARRLQRIYPAFIAVFLLYVALSFVFPAESKIPAQAMQAGAYLLMNFLLLPGVLPLEPMITVAWSLSYEMFYYLCIPAIIVAFGLRGRSVRYRVVFFSALAIGMLAGLAWIAGPVRLTMFIAGILLFEALRTSPRRAPHDAVALGALLMGLAAMLLQIGGPAGYVLKTALVFLSFFLLCLTCFARADGPLASALGWSPLRWLGNMSYSYYLLHGLALKGLVLVLAHVFPPAAGTQAFFWLFMPIGFLLTSVPTAGLFLLVERPFSMQPAAEAGAAHAPGASAPAS